MSEKLKPCPFCGSDAVHFRTVISDYVSCDNCGNGTAGYSTKQKALKAWNKRHKEERG
jgi:Lar family restriction alleviation protein